MDAGTVFTFKIFYRKQLANVNPKKPRDNMFLTYLTCKSTLRMTPLTSRPASWSSQSTQGRPDPVFYSQGTSRSW